MGIIKKQRLLLIILVIVFTFLGYLYIYKVYPRVVPRCTLSVLNDKSKYRYYIISGTNKMECDLSTLSLIVRNMQQDGFNIYQEIADEDVMDVIMQKNELFVRIYYRSDGTFTSVASEYEKSCIPMSYINESK